MTTNERIQAIIDDLEKHKKSHISHAKQHAEFLLLGKMAVAVLNASIKICKRHMEE